MTETTTTIEERFSSVEDEACQLVEAKRAPVVAKGDIKMERVPFFFAQDFFFVVFGKKQAKEHFSTFGPPSIPGTLLLGVQSHSRHSS